MPSYSVSKTLRVSNAIAKVKSFSRNPFPTAPGSFPPCPGSMNSLIITFSPLHGYFLFLNIAPSPTTPTPNLLQHPAPDRRGIVTLVLRLGPALQQKPDSI